MANRVIMHVDLDYFYAQCEENRNPSIKGKPVVVCVYSGRTEDSGVVSTSNYPARKYGVRAGVPITRAKRLLESTQAIFLPMDRPYYEQVSKRIMDILRVHGDSFEQVGIDEAYLDVSTSTTGSYEEAEVAARDIKSELVRKESATSSIGIAPNKLLAKIASDERKPDGLTVIKPQDVSTYLQQLPATRVSGVGRKVEEKLETLHVKTLGQLSTLSPTLLTETFGKSLGSYLYHASRGENEEPVKEREQPTQLSRIATLKHDTHELAEILPLLHELSQAITRKLKDRDMSCKSVSIIAILSDLSIHSKSKMLDQPTFEGSVITTAAQELMKEFLESKPNVQLRRAGVKVTGLSKPAGQKDIAEYLKAN